MGKLLALKTAPADRAAIIDEFGDIAKLRADFAPTEKRHKQLSDEIKTWYEDSPADQDFVEKGTRYQLDISPCSNVTLIDVKAAKKKLGLAKFLKCVSITLKALAVFLTEPEIAELTSTEQTGYRSYKPTPMIALPPNPGIPVNAASSPDAVREPAAA